MKLGDIKQKKIVGNKIQTTNKFCKDDADKIIENLKRQNGKVRVMLYRLKTKEAWRFYGYEKWKDFVHGELRFVGSLSYVDRLVRSAEVEKSLSVPIGTLAESVTRKLFGLESDERKRVWEKANSLKGEKLDYPTAKTVDLALNEMDENIIIDKAISKIIEKDMVKKYIKILMKNIDVDSCKKILKYKIKRAGGNV